MIAVSKYCRTKQTAVYMNESGLSMSVACGLGIHGALIKNFGRFLRLLVIGNKLVVGSVRPKE